MILLDMDGVLANFVDGAIDALALDIQHDDWASWNHHHTLGISDAHLWDAICSRPNFWLDLAPYKDGLRYYHSFDPEQVVICTMPCRQNHICATQKIQWLRNNGVTSRYIITTAPKALLAGSGMLLVDDSVDNVNAYSQAGGKAFLWERPWNRKEWRD